MNTYPTHIIFEGEDYINRFQQIVGEDVEFSPRNLEELLSQIFQMFMNNGPEAFSEHRSDFPDMDRMVRYKSILDKRNLEKIEPACYQLANDIKQYLNSINAFDRSRLAEEQFSYIFSRTMGYDIYLTLLPH